jgi:hypothetical protein
VNLEEVLVIMLMESLLICSKDYKPKKWVFVFFAAVYFAAAGWMNHDDLLAEDIVFLKRSAIQSGRTRFQGTIREFDSDNLYLVTRQETDNQYPANSKSRNGGPIRPKFCGSSFQEF